MSGSGPGFGFWGQQSLVNCSQEDLDLKTVKIPQDQLLSVILDLAHIWAGLSRPLLILIPFQSQNSRPQLRSWDRTPNPHSHGNSEEKIWTRGSNVSHSDFQSTFHASTNSHVNRLNPSTKGCCWSCRTGATQLLQRTLMLHASAAANWAEKQHW